ncbi:hypothetical protein PTTG_30000 [Puccinia triticina 1-1 BBBD Race 1]|uniref:DUF4219 domain-containing protein n=1 Tax=Puccinia triticina (isolate 1-1 / race 1 (BBBD)) TaxID=630390 RepID=A0A180G1D3_PUCT1|nr:hypothetical protein PTTG_30000 [Puccinia triticina 1-1 BBBD Race 1]
MAGTRQTPVSSSSTAANTSTSKERDLFKCPTFDGNNFPIWQRKVKTYLAVKSLMKCIEQPLPANATQEQKQDVHVEDDIYNHIITDANIHDALAIWKELKNEYASSSVLAIYHAWRKWEDIQYDNDINQYIT